MADHQPSIDSSDCISDCYVADYKIRKEWLYMYEVYLLVGFLTFWLTVIVLIASAGYQLRKSVVRAGGWSRFWKNFFGMEESE